MPGRYFLLPLSAVAVGVLAAGCAADKPAARPTKAFAHDVSDTRVYASYRQSDEVRKARVTFGTKSDYIRIRIECSNDKGAVRVALASRWHGSVGCEQPVVGYVMTVANKRHKYAGPTQLSIHAAHGSTWSVAVDAGPRADDPTAP